VSDSRKSPAQVVYSVVASLPDVNQPKSDAQRE
jgi:hypothetical protein